MPTTKDKTLQHRAPNLNTSAFWCIGKPTRQFPLFLDIPSNNAAFSAAQMTYLRANKQVAWQVATYLREPQVITPGGGNDPYVVEYAEKAETVKAFADLLAEDATFAQANANAGFPAIGTDNWAKLVNIENIVVEQVRRDQNPIQRALCNKYPLKAIKVYSCE